jgi:hypothetical protein
MTATPFHATVSKGLVGLLSTLFAGLALCASDMRCKECGDGRQRRAERIELHPQEGCMAMDVAGVLHWDWVGFVRGRPSVQAPSAFPIGKESRLQLR